MSTRRGPRIRSGVPQDGSYTSVLSTGSPVGPEQTLFLVVGLCPRGSVHTRSGKVRVVHPRDRVSSTTSLRTPHSRPERKTPPPPEKGTVVLRRATDPVCPRYVYWSLGRGLREQTTPSGLRFYNPLYGSTGTRVLTRVSPTNWSPDTDDTDGYWS